VKGRLLLLIPLLAAPAFARADGATASVARSVLRGGLPGTFEIPGTGLSLGFGGYAKMDLNFSSASTDSPGGLNTGDQFVIPALIEVRDNAGESDQLTFNIRESRVWFKAFRPSSWGDFNAYVEIDFYAFQAPGNERISNSFAPRLRHAYGTLGNLLVGQTWSTFMNASAIPENLDFVGSVGTAFDRQSQIRWTQPLNETWSLKFAVEQPETTATSTTGARVTPGDDRLPDLIVGLHATGSFGNVTLTFLARELRIDDDGDPSTHFAGGASLAGRVHLFNRDNIRFNLNAGTGLGRYVSLNFANGGYLDEERNLIGAIPIITGHVAYQHFWNDYLRSSATFSFAEVFNPDALQGTAINEQAQGAIINLLFSPIPRTTFGIEYYFARRAIEGGADGILHRGQTSAKFVF